ncbi:MAG: hypothetical protein ABW252_00905 [Polyangiales bacterium]
MNDRTLLRRSSLSALLSVCTLLGACADDASDASASDTLRAEAAGGPSSGVFPPPSAGYTRLVAPVIKDIKPGQDVLRCQYIQAPLDRDIDVIDVTGHQSEGGHHAVTFASSLKEPVGTSRGCTDTDNLAQGAFLGGVGGEAGGGSELPDGVAFRLKKGQSIMLSTHFLNVSDGSYDGHSVVDFKFAEVDPNRPVASLFTNGNFSFRVGASNTGEAVAECKLPRQIKFFNFANHMHDYGTWARSEIVRADGTVELIHEDPIWTYEMQFQAVYRNYGVATPLVVNPGDVLRTTCKWKNPTNAALNFPREMCIGTGFFVSDGSSSPVCFNGQWMDNPPAGAGGFD